MSLVLAVVRKNDAIVASEGRTTSPDGKTIRSEHFTKHQKISDNLIVASAGTIRKAESAFMACEAAHRAATRFRAPLVEAVRTVLDLERYQGPDDGFQSLPVSFAVVRDGCGDLRVIMAGANEPLTEYQAGPQASPTVVVLAPCQQTNDLAMRELTAASRSAKLEASPKFNNLMRMAMEGVFIDAANISTRLNRNTSYSVLERIVPGDALTWQRVKSVSGNEAQTDSVASNAVTGSAYAQSTTYVNITSSGTISSITGISLPASLSYVKVTVNGAIASTNSSALGWAINLYNAASGGTRIFGWDYMGFSAADIGSSIYKPFEFSFIDYTGSTAYRFDASTNSGGTVSFIPVYMTVEIFKR